MYKVYISQSIKDNRTYVGYTSDISKRLVEHNSGKVDATKNRRPLKVIYIESVKDLEAAKKRERYWKSDGGRRKLKRYFKDGFPPMQGAALLSEPRLQAGGSPQIISGRRFLPRGHFKKMEGVLIILIILII